MIRFLPHGLRRWPVAMLDLMFPEATLDGEVPEPTVPPFCEQCGERFEGDISGQFECSNCQGRCWHFAWARAQYPSRGAVRQAIHDFKYNQHFYYRRRLVGWLEAAYRRHAAAVAWDALVPVPLHALRRRDRGFNQAEELAAGLSVRCNVPVLACLKRLHDTSTQTTLTREERWRNLHGAFGLRSKFDVKGRNLLLIDDVFTTGATCEGCAQVLQQAGAHLIGVLTVARG